MFLRVFYVSLGLTFTHFASAQPPAPNLTDVLAAIPDLSTLTGILSGAPDLLQGILSYPSDLTILAPSNAAFKKAMKDFDDASVKDKNFLSSLLSFHILNETLFSYDFKDGVTVVGSTFLKDSKVYANLDGASQVVFGRTSDNNVMVFSGLGNASKVEKPDIQFNRGVLHIIDTVLTLPQKISTTALHFNLTALAGALNATGLLNITDTTAKLTVFAPNNFAFQQIGNLVDGLSKEQLVGILTYHAVTGDPVYNFKPSQELALTTLQGGKILIHQVEGAWFVNGARIIGGNEGGVVVGNGVVYVIDSVLNPANANFTTYNPNPTASTQPPAFPGASYVPDVPFTGQTTLRGANASTSIANIPSQTTGTSGSARVIKVGGHIAWAASAVIAVMFGMGCLMV